MESPDFSNLVPIILQPWQPRLAWSTKKQYFWQFFSEYGCPSCHIHFNQEFHLWASNFTAHVCTFHSCSLSRLNTSRTPQNEHISKDERQRTAYTSSSSIRISKSESHHLPTRTRLTTEDQISSIQEGTSENLLAQFQIEEIFYFSKEVLPSSVQILVRKLATPNSGFFHISQIM